MSCIKIPQQIKHSTLRQAAEFLFNCCAKWGNRAYCRSFLKSHCSLRILEFIVFYIHLFNAAPYPINTKELKFYPIHFPIHINLFIYVLCLNPVVACGQKS